MTSVLKTAFFAIFLCALLAVVGAATCDKYEKVNPFIGTGGLGYGYGGINPGANYPYGFLRLGPDTTTTIVDISYRHFSGYHYTDDQIRSFSHTHLVGGGVNDLGNFGVMPVDSIKLQAAKPAFNSWWSTFNKTSESAKPGYYAVHLDEPSVDVELLAISTSASIHRYTYRNNAKHLAGLIVDVCHTAKLDLQEQKCLDASITFDADKPGKFQAVVQAKGSLSGTAWYYLHAELVHADGVTPVQFTKWNTCTDRRIFSSACSEESSVSSTTGTLFTHTTMASTTINNDKDFTVELRVGLSHISVDNAEQNLINSLPSAVPLRSFNALRKRTEATWCSALAPLTITPLADDADITAMLYSAYYRTHIAVTDYTESGGLYVGLDNAQVHNVLTERATAYPSDAADDNKKNSVATHFFSDLSLWDTFRTYQPWQLLTNEALAIAIGRSMSDMTLQQKAFPRWPLAGHESSCMLGEGGASLIVELLDAGFGKEIDIRTIQQYLLLQLTQANYPINGRTDVQHYLDTGYVSQEVSNDATCETLTNVFDDYSLGKISLYVNDIANGQAALTRSLNSYKTIWSAEQLFFCPKYAETNELDCPSSGTAPETWTEFREGDALHWMWSVSHDITGFIKLFPSTQSFQDTLESFLTNHVAFHEKFGSAAPNPYFWAGNEHDFLAPYLFNYGTDCTRTQYWARRLTQMHYSNTPHGIPGNEDYGSMSTWLMFTSLGLFPQACVSVFLLGSPRVASASIDLQHWDGHVSTLTIKTVNNSADNVYVQKLLVNGEEWHSPSISRSILMAKNGVTLEFYMQAEAASGLCAAAAAAK